MPCPWSTWRPRVRVYHASARRQYRRMDRKAVTARARKPYRPAVTGSSPGSAAIPGAGSNGAGSRGADHARRGVELDDAAVRALAARLAGAMAAEPMQIRDAVRSLLARLRERAPGRSVEVRVPP